MTEAPAATPSKRKVLVADDEQVIANTLAIILNQAGFEKVRIVASSGFGVEKCSVMADASTPIDVVGTGSFIPETWSETYATADIVAYNGTPMVKIGREFLLRSVKRDLG